MAGKRFNIRINEILPGTYINYETGKTPELGASERGIALIPLLDADFGPAGEVIEISNRFPNQRRAMLGHDISDDTPSMFLIRNALMNAVKVKCWIPKEGAKAKADAVTLTPIPLPAEVTESDTEGESTTPVAPTPGTLSAEAKYGGVRGNDLSYAIVANPMGGYDVSVYLGTEEMELFEGLKNVTDLMLEESEYITFTGSGDLAEVAGVTLSGGTNGEVTNADMMDFVDALDNIKFTTLIVPISGKRTSEQDNTELLRAMASKIIALRDECGKYVNAVFAQYKHGKDGHESLVNVTNGYWLEDGTLVTEEKATAWVGGATCSATKKQSLTYVEVPDAVKVYRPKDDYRQKQAILNGEFFFISKDDSKVIVCKDINTLTDWEAPNEEAYSHNRIMRAIDTFCEAIMVEFPPNRFDNNSEGWDLMDGLGAALLKKWEDEGAFKDVQKGDFKMDRAACTLDNMYADIAAHPVDSGEKLHFTIKTL